MDWSGFRKQFPALEGRFYLNTAGGGPMSVRAAQAGINYYRENMERADDAWNDWLSRLEEARKVVADWVGGTPNRVSFLQNASLGLNIIARSFPGPIRILAVDQEFASCTTPFMRAEHGIDFIPTEADGGVSTEDLDRATLPGTKALVLSSVQYANGFRADLEQIGAWCRSHGLLFIVDATQSISAFPLDVQAQHIDYLVFSGYKWATAGYGNAVLYCGSRSLNVVPPLVGWRSARRPYDLANDRLDILPAGVGHEMGHPAFPNAFALAASVRVMAEVGISAIEKRILELVSGLREGLSERGFAVRSSSRPASHSGIVLVDVEDASEVAARLERRNVFVSARDGGIRVSVHAYNNADDVGAFLTGLEKVVPAGTG